MGSMTAIDPRSGARPRLPRLLVGDAVVGNEILNETRPDVIEAKYVRLQSG